MITSDMLEAMDYVKREMTENHVCDDDYPETLDELVYNNVSDWYPTLSDEQLEFIWNNWYSV